MAPHAQPMAPATRPPDPPDPREPSQGQDDDTDANSDTDPDQPTALPAPTPILPRDLVRLFQCQICSLPLREPVCLPCGKSMCRRCLPQTHLRTNISYPDLPGRLEGFRCPFPDCGKEHAVEDCAVDVILNKVSQQLKEEIDLRRSLAATAGVFTRIYMQDPWAIAGVASLRDEDGSSQVFDGGKIVATYTLAEDGDLKYQADISYQGARSLSDGEDDIINDEHIAAKAQEMTRAEMDCQVCYALFCDPFTTACGHTFCRSCLHRVLDHSRYCPICRRQLAINPLLNHTSCPSNQTLNQIINSFWSDDAKARKEAVAAESASQLEDLNFPLFVCTLAFPRMPTFLHVFEPRYRLLIRRALEGDRTFGMVLPRLSMVHGQTEFLELGTMLRIVNVQYYPDGRSLIETIGVSRFRVLRHGYLDGYIVGKVERVDDVSLEEEESMEAAEAVPQTTSERPIIDDGNQAEESSEPHPEHPPEHPPAPITSADIETMSTQSLMEFTTSFVTRMRAQGVPWLTERLLSIYGEHPNDAAIFPWWFASMLPVKDLEKYRLLGTSSVRERLKICCSWIIEWEASRWMELMSSRPGLSATAQSSS
ncbi:PUA-like domain-containing protein [Dactylonectria macrodidyma]|uniref:PUA-like domain-containing protein n=1 Tax=Dactylonectria macrodidyma TaxID=307937 RepID=A0A9P9ET40_9HYPO|nr:PUA-like domain-containing protein [Dactylonectria macrodidyma]